MNKYKMTLNGRFVYIQHEEIDQRILFDEGARFTQFADSSQYARNGHSSSVHHWSFYGLVCPLYGFGMQAFSSIDWYALHCRSALQPSFEFREFLKGSVWKPLLISMAIMFFQQFTVLFIFIL